MVIPGAAAPLSQGPTHVPHVRPSAPTRPLQCLTHKQAHCLLLPHTRCPVLWSLHGSWFYTPGRGVGPPTPGPPPTPPSARGQPARPVP